MSNEVKNVRTLHGVVVSDKMQSTITVLVERKEKHPLYHKYVKKMKKFHVDDPDNSAHVGDEVIISECRPVSKTKNWKLVSVVKSEQ